MRPRLLVRYAIKSIREYGLAAREASCDYHLAALAR